MNYNIKLLKKARKFIETQPKNQQERILKAINNLPESGDIIPLSGRNGFFRLRVGDYRIIYRVQNEILLITVVNADNRGQVYKNRK